MPWLLFLLLLGVCIVGMFLLILTLPGLWLMTLAAGAYAWATHEQFIGFKTLAALLALALIGEVLETFASSAGAKRAGASRRGLWGAIIGGVLGAIILAVPIPIIGAFVGILIGTFLGALIGELSGGKHVGGSLKVGVGAAKGRFVGTMSKLAIGVVMLVMIFLIGLPFGGGRKVAASSTIAHQSTPIPASAPATLP